MHRVAALDAEGMIAEGRILARIARNVAVKVPLTWDGLKACRTLTSEGTMVNVTLCFSPAQALLAAKAGATFVSPFVGRLDSVGHIGMDLVKQTRTIYDTSGFQTQILTAAVRHPEHVLQAALAGSDVCTMFFDFLKMLYDHPLTDIGLAKFLADWEKAYGATAATKA